MTDKLHTYALRQGETDFPMPVDTVLTFNNADVYHHAGLAGLGIIAIPRAAAQRYFNSGEMVEVLPDWPPDGMPVSVVYPYARRLSARVRAFVDWASALFEDNPLWRKD